MSCRTAITRLVLLPLLFLTMLTPLSPNLPAKAGAGPISRDDAIPPFDGTIFLDSDIIIASDPTTFQDAPYAGQGERMMFDRRVNGQLPHILRTDVETVWIYQGTQLFGSGN